MLEQKNTTEIETQSEKTPATTVTTGTHNTIQEAKQNGVTSPVTNTFVIEGELKYLYRNQRDEYTVIELTDGDTDRLVPVKVTADERSSIWGEFETKKLPNMPHRTFVIESIDEENIHDSIKNGDDPTTVFLTGYELENGIGIVTGIRQDKTVAEQSVSENIPDKCRVDAKSESLKLGPETFNNHIIADYRSISNVPNTKINATLRKIAHLSLTHDIANRIGVASMLTLLLGMLGFTVGFIASDLTGLPVIETASVLEPLVIPVITLLGSGVVLSMGLDKIEGTADTRSLIDTSIPVIAANKVHETNANETMNDTDTFESVTAQLTTTNDGVTITATVDDELATWRFRKNQAGMLPEDVREFIRQTPVVTENNTTQLTIKRTVSHDQSSKWVSENGEWEITRD